MSVVSVGHDRGHGTKPGMSLIDLRKIAFNRVRISEERCNEYAALLHASTFIPGTASTFDRVECIPVLHCPPILPYIIQYVRTALQDQIPSNTYCRSHFHLHEHGSRLVPPVAPKFILVRKTASQKSTYWRFTLIYLTSGLTNLNR